MVMMANDYRLHMYNCRHDQLMGPRLVIVSSVVMLTPSAHWAGHHDVACCIALVEMIMTLSSRLLNFGTH